MPDCESVTAGDAPAASAAAGSGLMLSLTCPDCGEHGWIKWQDLSFGLKCPKCGCKFLLNRSGKLQSLAELPQVKYRCPRCRQSGTLPVILAVRAAECGVCKLPLVCDSQQRMQPAGEVRQSQQAASSVKKPSGSPWWENFFMNSDGRLRKGNVALVGLLLLGVFWAGLRVVGGFFDNSPGGRVRAMVYACLAGDQDGAAGYLPDEALQRVEFERWRVRYFPSILDKHRPEGDKVRIAVEPISQSAESQVFRVTMTSPFIGKRSHEQHWRNVGGQWRFDPAATLRTDE